MSKMHPILRKLPKKRGIGDHWVPVRSRYWYSNEEEYKYIYVNKAVYSFLKTHSFSRVHILKLINSSPCELCEYSALETFQPNIEFLRSKGLSGPQTAEVICSCPTLLRIDLANQIVPAYDALNSFFQSDSTTAVVVRNCPKLLLKKNVDPLLLRSRNILYGCGVPQSDVVRLLAASPRIITMRENNLKQVFGRLIDEMGLDSSTHNFLEALGVFTRFTRSQWEWKLRLFEKWGLSDDQVITGFRQYPKLMTIPAEKINGVMELLVNWLGMEPSVIIVTCPALLQHSVSKRFIPRVSALISRICYDLTKKEEITPDMFMLTDKCFVHKYILPAVPVCFSSSQGRLGISMSRESFLHS